MGKRAITIEVYEALLNAFRAEPGDAYLAAKRAKVYWKTAERAWHEGWPQKGFAPIGPIVREEQQEARAKLEHEKSKKSFSESALKSELTRQDSLESRMQEARLVRGARENSIALMAATQRLLSGTFKLSSRVSEYLATEALSPKVAMSVVSSVGKLVRDSNESAKLALQMERLLVGAPTEILGVTDVSIEDAELETRRALAALEEARRLGVLSAATVEEAKPAQENAPLPTPSVTNDGTGTGSIH